MIRVIFAWIFNKYIDSDWFCSYPLYMKKSAKSLLPHLRAGRVYKRSELAAHSSSVDRDLKYLEEEGHLSKVGPGLYHCPKKTEFGVVPPHDNELVRAFLGEDKFLLFSPTDYNQLELGTTQTYNERIVYNHKRHETLTLGGKSFRFVRPKAFPRKMTKEFLLVDMFNHMNSLAENVAVIENNLRNQLQKFDLKALARSARSYGKVRTKKYFTELLNVHS